MAFTWLNKLPQQRRYRFAVSIFFFLQGFCFASWTSRIPDIKMALNLSDGELGTILFGLPAGLMTSLPLSGWIVSKYSSRTAILISSLLYPVTLICLGLVTAPWQLFISLFVFGIWGNMFNIAVNTQAVGVEAIYSRSIMASFHGVWSLSGLIGAAFGWLQIRFANAPFVHFCISAGVAWLILVLFYNRLLPKDNNAGGSAPIFAKPDSVILKLGLIAFCSMVAEGTMFDWSGVYFQNIVHAPKELVTIGFIAFMTTMAGGRFAADWLTNRIGKKTTLQISGVLIAAGLAIAILLPTIVFATLGFLLVGLGVSSIVPLVYGAAGRSKTMSPGVALAAVSTIGFLGFLAGPPAIGFIAEMSSLKWSFAVIAALGFCNTFLASRVKVE